MKGSDDLRRLGLELRQLREEAHLTQVQLAELLSVTQPTISSTERGINPTTTDLMLRWVATCRGRLTVMMEREDPFSGIEHEEGKELLSLWRRSPKDLRLAVLGMLRAVTPKGEA